MSLSDQDDARALLTQARDRAAALVQEFRRQRDDPRAAAWPADADVRARGRAAIDEALSAAGRALAALESAAAGRPDHLSDQETVDQS